MPFPIKFAVGALYFCGWFILIYLGEMVLAWLPIVVANPAWAEPAAYILQVPAAAFSIRRAKASADKWERKFMRY